MLESQWLGFIVFCLATLVVTLNWLRIRRGLPPRKAAGSRFEPVKFVQKPSGRLVGLLWLGVAVYLAGLLTQVLSLLFR